MDFNKYLFHPSSLGTLMTDSRTKDPLGETCKAELLKIWVEAKYGRTEEVYNKYMEKGTLVEEDSITLYSRVKKTFYKKNTKTISNDYFIGTPDLYEGPSIKEATHIVDIKSSWSIFTFYGVFVKPVNKAYGYQLQAYMDLTGAKTSTLAYCLVDTPLHLVEDEKRKLQWKMGVLDPDSNPEFIAMAAQIEKNNSFGDIDINERYTEFQLVKDEEVLTKVKERLDLCREFLTLLK